MIGKSSEKTYSETTYSFAFESPEADRILNPDFKRFPKSIHFSSSDYPSNRTFHVEPGVTVVLGYDASCPLNNPPRVFVRLQGTRENKRIAKSLLERLFDLKLR